MPTFELTDKGGATYQIEAPDEHSAIAALGQVSAPQTAPTASAPTAPTESKGILQRIREGIDAPTRSIENSLMFGLGDRFRSGFHVLTGGGAYSDNLNKEQAISENYAKENPVASAGTNIVGGVASPLGALGAAAKGTSLVAKTLYGMGAGGLIGGVQGGLSSKDLTDIPDVAKNTAVGAGGGVLVGGALPVAGKVIGTAYNAAANAVRGNVEGMSRSASRHVVDAMMADNPARVQAEVARLGPDAMLADAGPAFLGKAQGASLNSDEGRSILQGALTARNQGTNQRIAGEVNAALGPAEDQQTVTNAIRAHRTAVDNQTYPAAFAGAPPVDTSAVLARLGPMIGQSEGMERRALTNLRDMLMVEHNGQVQPQTNAINLHKIKGELDNVIQYDAPGLGVPAAALSRQQGALQQMRGELNGALENQVPGYREANAQSAALARRGQAVDEGTQYLGSGKTTPSPDRFAADFAQREPGEQIAFAKGSRGNIDRVLGTKANDLQALRTELQGEGGWNTAKIATVHGQDAADRLVGTVDSNLKYRDTYNKVVENSQTAQRQAAASAMKPTPASETPLINPNMSLTGLVGAGSKKAIVAVANTLLRRDPTKSYGEVADVLSRQGAPRDAAIKAIVDAIGRRQGNAAMAPVVGDRAALVAAILANGYAHSGPRKTQELR